jgi:hypothetical protein
MPVARTSDYQVNGDLLADTLNDDLDKLVMMAQQNESELSRKLGLQLDDEDATMTLPLKDTRANKLLGFDTNGDATVSTSTVSEIDGAVAASNAAGVVATTHQFTGDGTTVAFTPGISADIPSAQSVIIDIDGVTQHTDTYTVSGKVVTFSVAPPLNGDIQIRIQSFVSSANDAENVTYTQGGTGSVSRTVENKLQESVSVKDFGAVGDGVTDDTAAIQAALDSGAKRVIFNESETYLVRQTGIKTIVGISNRFCLDVPTGVEIDGHFSTIKLDNSQNATILVNKNAGVSQDSEINIHNLNLDGNQGGQTYPAAGEMPVIRLWDATKCLLENIKVDNARDYAGRFLKCTKSKFFNLNCYSSDGDGWSFGISAHQQPLVDCQIDNIHAESCIGIAPGVVGNPQLFVVQNCTVGKISGRDSSGGIKIQDASFDSTFGSLIFTGNTNGTANSGIKIQGNIGVSLFPKNINIGQIVSRNAWGPGLYINYIDSVSIGSYMGFENGNGGGTGSSEYGVDICPNSGGKQIVQIGSIYSEDNGDSVSVRINGDSVSIQNIQVKDSVDTAVQITSAGRVNIDNIKHIDSGSNTTFVLKIDGDGDHTIGRVETNLEHSTSQTRVIVNGQYFDSRIGSIKLGSTDPLEGVVQLTNAASSTPITNGNIYRQYVGGAGSYFHPIIQILPFNGTSRALGNYSYSVTDSSAGAGFTINHDTAGASDYVVYKILGWTVVDRPSS